MCLSCIWMLIKRQIVKSFKPQFEASNPPTIKPIKAQMDYETCNKQLYVKLLSCNFCHWFNSNGTVANG